MAEILLVNPKRRRKKGRRRMSALQRKYFGKRRHRSTSSASAAPRRRRRRRSRAVARRRHNVYLNPRRRRSRRALTRSVRRRRRNPSLRGGFGSLKSSVMPTLSSGFVGATGAIGLDLLWGYTSKYLPDQIATSALGQYAAKLLGAVVIGMLSNKLGRRVPLIGGRGRELAAGAATVVLHDAMKAQLQSSFPQLQLGEYLTYAPTVGHMQRAGRLLSTGMGEYLSGIPDRADDMSYSGDWNGDGINGY